MATLPRRVGFPRCAGDGLGGAAAGRPDPGELHAGSRRPRGSEPRGGDPVWPRGGESGRSSLSRGADPCRARRAPGGHCGS